MVYPFLHVRIIGFNGLNISILGIKHVRSKEERSGPGGVIAVNGPECRCDIGEAATFELSILDVSHPFVIKFRNVEDVTLTGAFRRTVTQPALPFIPLRTVGGHTPVVPANSPESILIDGINHWI